MKLKKHIALLAIFFLVTSVGSPAVLASFSDIDSSHDNYDAIRYMQAENIVAGYSDGTFKPDQTINRAEFTKIIMGAIGKEAANGSGCFTDVKNEWFAPYVCGAKSLNIIGGYADGTFKPGKEINFAEAAKIIAKAFGLSSGTDPVWYKPFVSALGEKSAIPTSIGSFSKNVTRGEMAEMIYRLKGNVDTKTSVSYRTLAGEPLPTTLQITSIGASSAMPMTLLTITGTGFDTNSDIKVRFSDGKDFKVDVPSAELTYQSLKVAVPPMFAEGELTSGQVSVQLVETKGEGTMLSNAEPLQIQELPTPKGAAGVATYDLLSGAVSEADTLLSGIKGTSLDTSEIAQSLQTQKNSLETLATDVKLVMNDSSKTFELGTYDGNKIVIGSKDLKKVDRMIMGMLMAQGGETASVSFLDRILGVNPAFAVESAECMAKEAKSLSDQLGTEGEPDVALSTGYYGGATKSINCKTAESFKTGFLLVGGDVALTLGFLVAIGGWPAAAVVYPAALMVYLTLAGGMGMIGVGGALGQGTEGAKQLVLNGVQMVEDQLRDIIVGKVLDKIGEKASAVYDMITGSISLYDAFHEARNEIEGCVEPRTDTLEKCSDACDAQSQSNQTTYGDCQTSCKSTWFSVDLLKWSDCSNVCIGVWQKGLSGVSDCNAACQDAYNKSKCK